MKMTYQQRLDQAAAYAHRELRLDASESIVFARELLKVRAGLFEQKFPELKAQRLIPKNNDMSDVDEEFAYQTVSEYGDVKLGSSYSTDAPRADVSFAEATPQRVRPLTAAYGYTFHEAKVSAALGRNLPARKARAARKAIAFEVEKTLAFGASASEYGAALPGLLTLTKESAATDNNKVREYTPPNGDKGVKQWLATDNVTPLKTPDEILLDMHGMPNHVTKASNDVEHANTMLLPLPNYQHISQTRLGDGSDTTILRHFLATNPYIKRVEPWFKLDAAPNSEWTGRRAVCYDMSEDVLEYLLPVEFRQHAPQLRRMETIIDCDARIGGVVVYRHKAICYADDI